MQAVDSVEAALCATTSEAEINRTGVYDTSMLDGKIYNKHS